MRIKSYEIIDLKDFKEQLSTKDCEHGDETYTKGEPFQCVRELP